MQSYYLFLENLNNLNLDKNTIIDIKLYHSVQRKDRNRNSLVKVINCPQDAYIIFTGATSYRDINSYIFEGMFSSSDTVYFVVSHYFVPAGMYIIDDLKFDKVKAFISVGIDNSYGYLHFGNVRKLNK
ncbi:hypothetical protein ACYSNM_13445 [Myroides sp. LJL116]